MLEITPAAQKEIAAYFEGRDPQPIRLFLQEGG
jgi:Fe-S cluster assembly iron-binding protein IscA